MNVMDNILDEMIDGNYEGITPEDSAIGVVSKEGQGARLGVLVMETPGIFTPMVYLDPIPENLGDYASDSQIIGILSSNDNIVELPKVRDPEEGLFSLLNYFGLSEETNVYSAMSIATALDPRRKSSAFKMLRLVEV